MIDNNKNKGLIIIIVLMLIIILSLIGYIYYDKVILASNNSDKKIQNETNNNNNENTNNNNNNTGNIDENNDEYSNINKELDLSKCLNTKDISYSNLSGVTSNYGLSMKINQDNKSIALSIYNDTFMPIANQVIIGSTWGPNSTTIYQIKGFTKNVVDFFIGELGQDASGLTLFFLIEDGTVEYTPLFLKKINSDGTTYYDFNFNHDYTIDKKITDTYFMTMGKIDGVENVIKFYNVDASNGFDWKTTIGAKNDGSFYDLGNIIPFELH